MKDESDPHSSFILHPSSFPKRYWNMDRDLQRVYDLLHDARTPEDVLGVEPVVLPRGSQFKKRKAAYDSLKAVTSLSYSSPDDDDVARDLDGRLEEWYRQAQARIEIGAYNLQGRGRPIPLLYRSRCFDMGQKRCYVGPVFCQGEEATFYTGYLEFCGEMLGETLLKVATGPDTSPFIEREANLLAVLRKEEFRETDYLPCLLDRFDAGGRLGLVMRRVDGFNLEEVRQYGPHREGLHPKDMVWMLSRMLAVAGLAHKYGVVHGRICPRHVLIDPATHLGMLVGWGGAALKPATSGQRVAAPIPTFSAPEAGGANVGPWSDVYSIGKTFLWALGGDPETDAIPESVEPELQRFLLQMVHEDLYQRPEDCWQLFETLEGLKVSLWGEKRWRHLEMPRPRSVG
jgi:hypothetical protein